MTYFDIFPEVALTSSEVLITWPLAGKHRHFPWKVFATHWLLCQVFDALNIRIPDLFAFFTIVSVKADQGGRDTNKYQPITRGEFWFLR